MSCDPEDDPYMWGNRRPPAFAGNRAERRAAAKGKAANPSPLRTVSREVPVTVLQHADGSRQVVNHEADEPCYQCPCCALWARSLDTLAAAIIKHDGDQHGLVGYDGGDCLVCEMFNIASEGPAGA